MSAKSCLLCGAPLGRIRVGAGEDFCSREHRNQYRLKRSMECLSEANKVATLARRRENPKPLFIEAFPPLPGEPRAHTPLRAFESSAALAPQLKAGERRYSLQTAGPVRVLSDDVPKQAPAKLAPLPITSPAKPKVRHSHPPVMKPVAGFRAELMALRPATPGNGLRVSSGTAFRPRLPRASEAASRIVVSGSAGVRSPGSGKDFLPLARVRFANEDGKRLGVTELSFTTGSEQAPRMEWVGVSTDRERAI